MQPYRPDLNLWPIGNCQVSALIEALHLTGRSEEARGLFESILAQRTPSGLLSEDIDPFTGELWSNFPQTYSLVRIIICAMLLSWSWSTIR